MASRRVLLGTVCAAAVFATGCSVESSSPGTTTVPPTTSTVVATTSTAAPTTTSSTTTTSTVPVSTTTATTTTTIAPVLGLQLSPLGLGDALFGADAGGVVDYVNSILGIPTTDSGWLDPLTTDAACPGSEIRFVDWNDLSLFFSNDESLGRHFASFTYGPAFAATIAPYGLTTDAGIGVGASVAALRAAHPSVNVFAEDGINGPGFEIEAGLFGFLTGTTDTDTIISFVGGFGCGE